MKVKVADLRRAANRLFDHLLESGHEEVDVDRDYYWNIPAEKIYASYEQPSEFTMGQLSEDLQHLEKIASEQNPPIGYGLMWLSSLLRFIGAKIVA
jgi:hypothetical protein